MAEIAVDKRIPSVRGFMATHNARNESIPMQTLQKWLRVNALAHKAEKIDVRATQAGMAMLAPLLDAADLLRVRLSLRVETDCPPVSLPENVAGRLLDVLLCPALPDYHGLATWVEALRARNLDYRVQLQPKPSSDVELQALAHLLRDAKAVNLFIGDAYSPAASPGTKDQQRAYLDAYTRLAQMLDKEGVEANILQLPFCTLDTAVWKHCVNEQQYLFDHQQYANAAFELYKQTAELKPAYVDKILEGILGRENSWHSNIDNLLLPWILRQPFLYVRIWAWHKLTRHLSFSRKTIHALPENETEVEATMKALREAQQAALGSVCAKCKLCNICDHHNEIAKTRLPDVSIQAIAGEATLDPLLYAREQHKHYDAIDEARCAFIERNRALAEDALKITLLHPPTREIISESYEVEKRHFLRMPGTVRWLSFSNSDQRSSILLRTAPPFTISVTFGGGIAELIGFSFGRHAIILCHMISFSHKLTLHVAANGEYVLLRDGVLVKPVEFENMSLVPRRLPDVLNPRIYVRNVDGQLHTQAVMIWEGKGDGKAQLQKCEATDAIRYSVLIVCTRYTRRLQAALQSIAHQRGVDFGQLEVIVAYIPGLDATDDLIDSMCAAHPSLRIVRSPFPDKNDKAKGLMINESARLAHGEWIILMDSDILLPPDFFQVFAQKCEGANYMAPDGRVMLSPEITARILLGELKPWEEYTALLNSGGEYRHHESEGVPPGFCQCVKREIFEHIYYGEFNHFEGADWYFSKHVMKDYGGVTRLEGMKVLHLDHQGSQWYGTSKQM